MSRPLRLGMVGGGSGAFIGAVHRMAARLDGEWQVLAGALSSDRERALVSGREAGLAEDRTYGSWQEMLSAEQALPAAERIDAVAVVTPNHLHFPVARAFVAAGFNVICDKPLVLNSAEADELLKLTEAAGTVFAVTYNYSGYPMVREARQLVADGRLGRLRRVNVEYRQGWLATAVERQQNRQADWRTDPARSGIAGAIGDIGTHAENLLTTVTGLDITHICADLTSFVPGRRLDDDASMLLRLSGGARGTLTASQVCSGVENALSIMVYGELGGLEWHQERPNELIMRSHDGPAEVLRRGNPYLSSAAAAVSRVPSGHDEGFIEAFANIYRAVALTIRARREGRPADGPEFVFPDIHAGIRGVRFIEKTVESAASEQKWTALD